MSESYQIKYVLLAMLVTFSKVNDSALLIGILVIVIVIFTNDMCILVAKIASKK